ncbi:MAG: nitroreductase family deazaflavin-dependent oxidoreductase [Micromonosporaceae bacterium]|nr:nitroreductase family deazaflavin-dependent oxidoreductase [Micromonosporaceae bacterium]
MTSRGPRTARIGARLLRVRWLVRAPIWLYRARLGFIFGQRLLMLEHVGRVSGRRRLVVLEVIDHSPNRYVVASGFGGKAQWLRNVEANPQVRVSVGTRTRVPAVARRLPPDEAAAVIRRYRERHPRAWARLAPVLENTLNAPIAADGTTLPMVGIQLRAS